MAQRKVIKMDEESLLRRKSKQVDVFDEKLKQLIEDMKDTMKVELGVGLAAPQIGILKRVIICELDGNVTELINPEIIDSSGEVLQYEGCLSVSGKRGEVPRPETLTVVAQDINGKPIKMEAKGFSARVLCHEIDHLNGILYIDKATVIEEI